MEESKKSREDHQLERRTVRDRRTGNLDSKYQYSVKAGYFLDMRRGERRKTIPEDSLISLN